MTYFSPAPVYHSVGIVTETQELLSSPDPVVVDQFGFIREKSSSSQLSGQSRTKTDKARRRAEKWLEMLGPDGRHLHEALIKQPAKVKQRVRKGIPDPLRGLAWAVMAGRFA